MKALRGSGLRRFAAGAVVIGGAVALAGCAPEVAVTAPTANVRIENGQLVGSIDIQMRDISKRDTYYVRLGRWTGEYSDPLQMSPVFVFPKLTGAVGACHLSGNNVAFPPTTGKKAADCVVSYEGGHRATTGELFVYHEVDHPDGTISFDPVRNPEGGAPDWWFTEHWARGL